MARIVAAHRDRSVRDVVRSLRKLLNQTVQAVLDTNAYQKGIKITDKQMRAFEAEHLHRHEFHGDWTYTVGSQTGQHTHPATRPRSRK